MPPAQTTLSINLVQPWSFRRPIVYRYMNKEFVDAFFETGSLRLSSFIKFSQHHDEQRHDATEGRGMVKNTDHAQGGQTTLITMSHGVNSYVLCGSTRMSKSLSRRFQSNSGFVIHDPTAFGLAIANELAGFRAGLEGPCTYVKDKVVRREMAGPDLEAMRISPDRPELDMSHLFPMASRLAGDDLFFLKHSKYVHQSEYRWIWQVSCAQEHLDIRCPAASEFCTRFPNCESLLST